MSSIISTLDRARLQRFHYILLILAGMGVFLDGYDISIISGALLFLKTQFSLTPFLMSMVGAATSIGMLFGSIAFGYFADRMGRRVAFLWDLVFFVVFAIASALAQNALELITFRILLGVGLGADYALSLTIISEFSPASSRGALLGSQSLGWVLGALVAYAVAFLLAPLGSISWRWMLGLGAIPAIAVIIARRWLPESPRWLVAHGKAEKAAEIVSSLTGEKVTPTELEEKYRPVKGVPITRLFSGKVLRYTAFIWSYWFIFDFVFYGIGIFAPALIILLGLKGIMASLQESTILALLYVLANISGMLLLDRIGRKTLSLLGFIVSAAALFILGLMYPPPSLILLTVFPLYAFFIEFGPAINTFVYSAELFPTEVRATGQASSTLVSRIGAILGIFVLPALISSWGTGRALIAFGVMGLLAFLITLFLAPETKKKTLEQITSEGS